MRNGQASNSIIWVVSTCAAIGPMMQSQKDCSFPHVEEDNVAFHQHVRAIRWYEDASSTVLALYLGAMAHAPGESPSPSHPAMTFARINQKPLWPACESGSRAVLRRASARCKPARARGQHDGDVR